MYVNTPVSTDLHQAQHLLWGALDMAIVILGASQYDGRASKVLAARLDEDLAVAGGLSKSRHELLAPSV